ncbi:hypothetical protein FP2506_03665 [Fulvimarina pelagi HTCC2506]|uniref:Uncharacterized protein n=3 Tax=Fulvimarina pelagi TaxID=217511 RepID=Q0FZI5_9HYPH|nr:hypothetical protein FP2506_03665 [Fulvimarina pelagi HTCC2506]BAT31333.1 hypothetical protein [Fulvimarina pelagi]
MRSPSYVSLDNNIPIASDEKQMLFSIAPDKDKTAPISKTESLNQCKPRRLTTKADRRSRGTGHGFEQPQAYNRYGAHKRRDEHHPQNGSEGFSCYCGEPVRHQL